MRAPPPRPPLARRRAFRGTYLFTRLLSETACAGVVPIVLANYEAIFAGVGSKKGPMKAASKAALGAVAPLMPAEAAPLELGAIFKAMAVEQQGPTRVAALEKRSKYEIIRGC